MVTKRRDIIEKEKGKLDLKKEKGKLDIKKIKRKTRY